MLFLNDKIVVNVRRVNIDANVEFTVYSVKTINTLSSALFVVSLSFLLLPHSKILIGRIVVLVLRLRKEFNGLIAGR